MTATQPLWTAPSFDGGSPVTGYRIYRATASGGESYLQSVGVSTSFVDSAVTNGTTYYYKVAAENSTVSDCSQTRSRRRRPSLVPPDLPLPIVDNFDRPNENPLLDGLRWTNGVIGSGESGLYIPNNWFACSRSTTCTAWRNSAQYGPDSESWARIATLPGTANSVRLYVRIQQPGSAAADGYELRTIQQAGTDQVLLERVDNGTLVTRLTINQELAAGDTLLLRAKGTTIEAWRNDGTSWARLGVVNDSTYSAGGYTGIGLRGTTGRLEDFGARTMGGPPPDTEPPSAPGTLTATAVSTSQIDLTLGRCLGQRRRRALPDRALLGGLRQFLGDRDHDRHELLLRRPQPLDRLLLPRACRGCRPACRGVLEHCLGDDPDPARHRAAERAGNADRDGCVHEPDRPHAGALPRTTSPSCATGSSAARPAAPVSRRSRPRPPRATPQAASAPRPPTPTACVPRMPSRLSGRTRTLPRRRP